MIIGIDGNEANVENPVGIGRYAIEVLKYLHRNQEEKFEIYLKNRPIKDLPIETEWWRYKVVEPKPLWTQFGLPVNLFLSQPKPDVFFSPTHYAPRFCPCPRVISIMDLSYLYYPELFDKDDLYQLVNWTKYSVNKAKKILTISQHTKEDIIKHYQRKDEDIIVTYPGYDSDKFKIHPSADGSKFKVDKIKKKHNIQGDYILYVGTLQPRKNIARLIEAYHLLNKKRHDTRYQLVIAGKKGWMYEQIFKTIKNLGLQDKVIFTGFIEDADLPFLYGGASCFVLPSFYEGFGLTVVEAMACGCPVIVSNVSSLPEIAGDAASYINPLSTEEITNALDNYLINPKLRHDAIKRGLEQVKKFSWKNCGQQTYTVLMEVASSNV